MRENLIGWDQMRWNGIGWDEMNLNEERAMGVGIHVWICIRWVGISKTLNLYEKLQSDECEWNEEIWNWWIRKEWWIMGMIFFMRNYSCNYNLFGKKQIMNCFSVDLYFIGWVLFT